MFCFPKRQKAFPSKRWQAREIANKGPNADAARTSCWAVSLLTSSSLLSI